MGCFVRCWPVAKLPLRDPQHVKLQHLRTKVAAIHQCISCISVLRDLLTSFLRSMCASSESMLGSKSIFNSVHLRWSSGKAAALRLASSSVAEASYPPANDERLAIDDGSER